MAGLNTVEGALKAVQSMQIFKCQVGIQSHNGPQRNYTAITFSNNALSFDYMQSCFEHVSLLVGADGF